MRVVSRREVHFLGVDEPIQPSRRPEKAPG